MRKIDLHRVRHEDVRRSVIRFVEDNWNSGEEGEIVTGNSLLMKAQVRDILLEYGLTSTEGRRFDVNTGCIITWFE